MRYQHNPQGGEGGPRLSPSTEPVVPAIVLSNETPVETVDTEVLRNLPGWCTVGVQEGNAC